MHCATNLFYRQGFHGTALEQIIESAETTKTTLYKYFPSKEDLALECIKRRDARWRERLPQLLCSGAGPDPVEQLRYVWTVWREWFGEPDFNGCMFIHACSEFPDPRHPCHVSAAENIAAIRGVIRSLAERARFEDPVGFSERYILVMQGAVIMEVVEPGSSAVATARAIAESMLEDAVKTADVPKAAG